MGIVSRQQSIIMFQKLPCMQHPALSFTSHHSLPIPVFAFPLEVLSAALRASLALFEGNLSIQNMESIEQVKIESVVSQDLPLIKREKVLQEEGERGKKKVKCSQSELAKTLISPQLKRRSISQEQSTHPSVLTFPSPLPLIPKHSKKIVRTSLRAPWKIPRVQKNLTCKPTRQRRRKTSLPYATLPPLISTDALASKLEELLSRGVSGWQRQWQGRRPRQVVNLAP